MPKLCIIQNGDYAEAYTRLHAGEPETYRDQFQTVRYVANLAPRFDVTTVAICSRAHDQQLSPSLRSIGVLPDPAYRGDALPQLLGALEPDFAIFRTPHRQTLDWLVKNAVPTLPTFADFVGAAQGPRSLWANWQLRRRLARLNAPCISNHSDAASQLLVDRLGIPEDRVVPWEWAPLPVAAPRTLTRTAGAPTVLLVSKLSTDKGVGDLLEAIALLKGSDESPRLEVCGPGDVAPWAALAAELGITDSVTFHGVVAHARVRELMEASDAVVVPSRHAYMEGLPNTIAEALAARAPLIVSDHPAYVRRLDDGVHWLVFPAGKPAALAATITRLLANQTLAQGLSDRGEEGHGALYFGAPWDQLVDHFLDDPKDTTGWVQRHALPACRLKREGAAGP